ncbi:MAG: hypothetical protein WAZ18_02965 [Alphaproteobacteria bacterium]
MVSSLPTLIKLEKHRVEQVQKQLNDTRAGIADMDAQLEALEAEVLRGGEVAAELNDPAVFGQAAAYIKVARIKAEKLKANRATLVEAEAKQLVTLNTHFAAQKRYETLHQRHEAAAKRVREGKIQQGLDEVAGVSWQSGEATGT